MISIVTAYYNRKALFQRTLESIEWFGGPEFEFVAVDDGSRDEERIEDLQERFNFLRVLRIDPARKWYANPCIPFNHGIRQAAGDIIVLQNPENLHAGPILHHVQEHARTGLYLAYACYALNAGETAALGGSAEQVQATTATFTLHDRRPLELSGEGWYANSRVSQEGYHYCSAITREDLSMLGGFDERYAGGYAYDDVEFAERIRPAGLEVRFVDDPFVFHQNHYPKNRTDIPWEKFRRNEMLYKLVSRPSRCVAVNGDSWGDPDSVTAREASEAMDALILPALQPPPPPVTVADERWVHHARRVERLGAFGAEDLRMLRELAAGALALMLRFRTSPLTFMACRSRHRRELERLSKTLKQADDQAKNRKFRSAARTCVKALRMASALATELSSRAWWWKGTASTWAASVKQQAGAAEAWWQATEERRKQAKESRPA